MATNSLLSRFKAPVGICLWLIFVQLSVGLAALPRSPEDKALIERFRSQEEESLARALRLVKEDGWDLDLLTSNGGVLVGATEDGRPIILEPLTVDAGISIAADFVANQPPLNLTGSTLPVGMWEPGGMPLTSHQEFGSPSRVTIGDSQTTTSNHSTWIAGIIGGAGVNSSALGMAPGADIRAFDTTNVLSEVTANTAGTAAQTTTISISAHPYGLPTGWSSAGAGYWLWYGASLSDYEDERTGQYVPSARDWDDLCTSRPFHLPFFAASNSRSRNPSPGDFIILFPDFSTIESYDPSIHPPGNGIVNGGYDTLGHQAVAKNVFTVGAITGAVNSTTGLRDPSIAVPADYTSWGPTDDGRIKPDCVTKGNDVFVADGSSPSAYIQVSGTSISTASAVGGALLLQEQFVQRYSRLMRAASMKGLLIHTADDLGTAGPDYQNGWGLLNIKAAYDLVETAFTSTSAPGIIEATLTGTDSYEFVSDGATPVRITLSWTDPSGTPQSGLDNPTPVLVNDLDIRLTDPSSGVSLPYTLNLSNPSAAALSGDNVLDPVERIDLAAPPAGKYVLTVSHKGLATASQDYSLIFSGLTAIPLQITSCHIDPTAATTTLSWTSCAGESYLVEWDTTPAFSSPNLLPTAYTGATGAATTATFPNPVTGNQRAFFRIRTP